MTVEKEKLSDLKEKYEKAEKLMKEESKNNPPTEPYKSHYLAKDILIELKNNVKNTLQGIETSDSGTARETYTFILSIVTIELGHLLTTCEEITEAENYLQQGLDLLIDYRLHPSGVSAYILALNQIGALWSNRNDYPKAKEYLLKAEETYKEFKLTELVPLTIYDIFGTADEIEVGKGVVYLESVNTMTLFYLAQVFGNEGDIHKSAVYCHNTLRKQLETKEYESIDWALNAATLSQYLCTNNRYKEARHHLAAATHILEEYQKVMVKPEMNDDEKKAVEENFKHRSADVSRCWSKYGLNLLSESRSRLLSADEVVQDIAAIQMAHALSFQSLIETHHERDITDRYLLDVDDARPVFIATIRWIESAKEYYNAETEASEYAKIVQDHALAYKHLSFFEADLSNQAKMFKRGADLLEGLLQLLNQQYYLSICRESLYELGLIYSNMLDIKLDIMNGADKNQPPNPHALKKINDLCRKGITSFSKYVKTYCLPNSDKLQPEVTAEELVPIAYAHFQIARLWYKIITPDKQMQIVNLNECLNNYQRFVQICEENQSVSDEVKGEVGVSKEMLSLLPMKIQKLKMDVLASNPQPIQS